MIASIPRFAPRFHPLWRHVLGVASGRLAVNHGREIILKDAGFSRCGLFWRNLGLRDQPGEVRWRHPLFRHGHKPPPDFGGQFASRDLGHGPVVVVAHPDAGQKVRGEADEPGIAPILAGSGLAGGGPANACVDAGAGGDHGLQHANHAGGVERVIDRRGGRRRLGKQHIAARVGERLDQIGRRPAAAALKDLVAAGELQQGHLIGAQRDRRARMGWNVRKTAAPGEGGHLICPHFEGEAHRNGVDRPGERLFDAHRAGVAAAVVRRRPSTVGDGRIDPDVGRQNADFHRRPVDEGLER